jgi:hypothetical protein
MLPSIATRLNVAIKNLFTGSSLGDGSIFLEMLAPFRAAKNRARQTRLLNRRSATRDQLDQQYNDRYHEKNVDEPAQGVRAY